MIFFLTYDSPVVPESDQGNASQSLEGTSAEVGKWDDHDDWYWNHGDGWALWLKKPTDFIWFYDSWFYEIYHTLSINWKLWGGGLEKSPDVGCPLQRHPKQMLTHAKNINKVSAFKVIQGHALHEESGSQHPIASNGSTTTSLRHQCNDGQQGDTQMVLIRLVKRCNLSRNHIVVLYIYHSYSQFCSCC